MNFEAQAPNLRWIEAQNRRIKAQNRSTIFISPLDLRKKTYIFTGSNQKLPNLHRKINESKRIYITSAFFHGFPRLDRVYRVLKNKTRHPTRVSRLLWAETHLRPSLAAGQFSMIIYIR